MQAQRKPRNGGSAGRKAGRGGGPRCPYNLPPSTEESERIALWISRPAWPIKTTPLTWVLLWRQTDGGPPRSPSLRKQYSGRWGRGSQTWQLYGSPKLFLLPLFFIKTDDKDHLLPIYWKLFFFSQLELFQGREPPAPSPQIAVRHLLNGPGSMLFPVQVQRPLWPSWLPAIHMCDFPFVVMAAGARPENIINFRSGLTNNKPTVSGRKCWGGQLSAGAEQ